MISDFLNDYQNNSIINKTKKRFYLFSNIALIVGIIFFLFIFYKNLSFVDTISVFIFPLIIVILLFIYLFIQRVKIFLNQIKKK